MRNRIFWINWTCWRMLTETFRKNLMRHKQVPEQYFFIATGGLKSARGARLRLALVAVGGFFANVWVCKLHRCGWSGFAQSIGSQHWSEACMLRVVGCPSAVFPSRGRAVLSHLSNSWHAGLIEVLLSYFCEKIGSHMSGASGLDFLSKYEISTGVKPACYELWAVWVQYFQLLEGRFSFIVWTLDIQAWFELLLSISLRKSGSKATNHLPKLKSD